MAFMEPEIYKGTAYLVDGPMGIDFVPRDLVGDLGLKIGETVSDLNPGRLDRLFAALRDYCENHEAYTIGRQSGWLARLSAQGYLDSTPWTLYSTRKAAETALCDELGEEDDDEEDER